MNPTRDELIKQNIVDHLIWDDSIDANKIHVSVEKGVAKLTGDVHSFAVKKAAEKDALQVIGVNKVENYLTVIIPRGIPDTNDVLIKSSIENKFLWNSSLNSSNINVEVDNGNVTLLGSVDTFWEKKLAEDIALESKGVILVKNSLTVKLSKSIIDAGIEEDIKKAFARNILIEEDKIDVSVNEGIVHLIGIVPFYAMKKEALDIAMYTGGVIDVRDEITIG